MQIENGTPLSVQLPGNGSGHRTAAAVAGNSPDQAIQKQPDVSQGTYADLLKQGGGNVNFQLNFSIDKDSKELVVKVINPATNEVIRQIPPQEILDLAASLQQMAGILIDKQI